MERLARAKVIIYDVRRMLRLICILERLGLVGCVGKPCMALREPRRTWMGSISEPIRRPKNEECHFRTRLHDMNRS